MLKQLRKISTRQISENPWWKYLHDRYIRPDGSEGDYFYIQTPGSVAVLPILDDGRLLLLKQFRYLNQRECIEFPGGGIERGMSPENAARKELLEEAGISAGRLRQIGAFNPMNGATDELCHVFVAEQVVIGRPDPESSEEFEEVIVSREELEAMIKDGTIWDGMTLAAFALYTCSME